MEIITTHTYYDFDALASLCVAHKLFPTATIILPKDGETNARAFVPHYPHLIPQYHLSPEEAETITTLILVDTRDPHKIDSHIHILPNMRTVVFDHHERTAHDLVPDEAHIKRCGATTTLLLQEFFRRGLSLSQDEALLCLLGIYEDTGMLTYPTTTKRDITIAHHLRNEYAIDMHTVEEYLAIHLHPTQRDALRTLQHNERVYRFGSFSVAFSYVVNDALWNFASVVHAYRESHAHVAMFCLFQHKGKVHIVGRSRSKRFPILFALKHFGGGGHATAASATVHTHNHSAVLDELRDLFFKKTLFRIPVSAFGIPLVADAEKHGVEWVTMNRVHYAVLSDEKERLARWDIRMPRTCLTYPVVALTGTHTLGAVYRVLSQSPCVFIVGEGEEKIFFTHEQCARFVEDVMGTPHTHCFKKIPERFQTIAGHVSNAAYTMGVRIYLAGGCVRDAEMGQEVRDMDCVVSGGDGIEFAKTFAHAVNAPCIGFPRFRTAKITYSDEEIDIATTRQETYPHPAALPVVTQGSMYTDCKRRDFTINAMALLLHKDTPLLVDFFGGQHDCTQRVVRVLHNLSFVEDPTRMYRAIRFMARLHCALDVHTARLLTHALSTHLYTRISHQRFKEEIKALLSETETVRVISLMQRYAMIRHIHPTIVVNKRLVHAVGECLFLVFVHIQDVTYYPWLVFLMVLCDSLSDGETQTVCTRLSLTARETAILMAHTQAKRSMKQLKHARTTSDAYTLLNPLPIEALIYLLAKTTNARVKKHIFNYLAKARRIKPHITGHTLKEVGIAEGRHFRDILHAVHHAKLDGKIHTYEEEMAFVHELIQKK